MYQYGKVNRVLVVAPLSILGVWEEEFEKFADFPYSMTILKGTAAKKKEQLTKLPDGGLQVVVVNYESAWRLEKELLAQNADHKDWCCTEELMKTTKDGKALYLHCLPADINDVSCKDGEVEASVFDRYRTPLYKEASYKPYIIAAMIFMAQVKDPVKALMELDEGKSNRKIF